MTFENIVESLHKLKDKEKLKNLVNILKKITSLDLNSANEFERLESEIIAKETARLTLEFINQSCKYGAVPDIDYEQGEISKKDFENYLDDIMIILEALLSIIKIVRQFKQECINKIELNNSVIQILILCASHDGDYDWTCESSRRLSQELLASIIEMNPTQDAENAVQSYGHGSINYEFYVKYAKSFFIGILPQLLDKKWKENPSFKHVFKWYLLLVKHPHLGELLPEVLPPALLFVDDYINDNKILGITCLAHIIDNVDPTELTWFGRAEVIYSALEHLLYTREAEVIPVLHPCILQILKIVEGDPMKIMKYNRYDKVFEMILSDMEFEQQLVLRRVYPLFLPQFIEAMGITVIRHIKRLLEVIGSYLDVYDGPEERARMLILLTLKSLILTAWPRIPHHLETILKILMRFLYDIEIDRTTTPLSVKENLIKLTKDCLLLLKKASPEKFKDLCFPLVNDAPQLPAINILKVVLETEDCACTLDRI